MTPYLTFIIPVRHQANAKNWGELRRQLAETAASVAGQTHPGWRAVVVANHGADLPTLPTGFDVCRVDFPANPLHERDGIDLETFYEAVRLDKGRRICAGLLHAGDLRHVMIVDDDDFISNRLTAFVADHPDANGWYVRNGYIWSGGSWLYLHHDFSNYCGTSHIIRADLLKLPASLAAADDGYLRRTLGSHVFLRPDLETAGTPLAPLPFPGAIYRTGHGESHSRSTSFLRHFLSPAAVGYNPLRLMRRLLRLKKIGAAMQKEFGLPDKEA